MGEFCIRHDLILCSDEIHSDLILESHLTHVPTNLLGPEISRRTVMLMSPSKTYNLPGLCCAYAVIENPELRSTFQKAARGIITEINAFGYVGCQSAYDRGEPWRQALLQYLRSNRDYLYSFAKEKLPGIKLRPMEATYLAWMDVRSLNLKNPAAFFEKTRGRLVRWRSLRLPRVPSPEFRLPATPPPNEPLNGWPPPLPLGNKPAMPLG